MNEEDRKLMMKIAKGLESLRKEVDVLKNKEEKVVPFLVAPKLTETLSTSGIEQNIEHITLKKEEFRLDIKMDGVDSLSFDQRRDITEKFIIELMSVFDRYKITKLSGNYVKPILEKK